MHHIIVYDFDGTVYKKDSLIEFAKYNVSKKPFRVLLLIPAIACFVLHKLKLCSTKLFKQTFLLHLYGIPPEELQKQLSLFWEREYPNEFNKELVKKINENPSNSICASASPDLYIEALHHLVPFTTVLATTIYYKNSRYVISGENCRANVKIDKLNHFFHHDYTILEAYSDNHDDIQLLRKAKKGYKMTSHKINPVKGDYTNKELVTFLKGSVIKAKFLDRIKIVYRPYICPFGQILEEIPADKKVFDIGCGSGQLALLIAEYCKPSKLKGIEISSELIHNAQSLLKPYVDKTSISFEVYDGEEIPSDIEEYDIITIIDVFHHVPKHLQTSFIDQLCKKIKPGAKIIFKDIEANSPLVYTNKLHDLLLAGEIGNEVTNEYIRQAFTANGLNVLKFTKKTTLIYPHYLYVFEKK